MFRYIAVVWTPADPTQAAAANLIAARIEAKSEAMQRALVSQGCLVYCADLRAGANEMYPFQGREGVILGKLFERSDSSMPPMAIRLTPHDSQQIVDSDGRHLVESYWGRYVAFWRDGTETNILRDPSGTFPCFETAFRGVRIYFSFLQDCLRLDLLNFSVNWNYIAAYLPLAVVAARPTGLNEVTQLYPGERKTVGSRDVGTSLLWDPSQFAVTQEISDQAVAMERLRASVRHTTRCWASCYQGILVRLSGGLDSTILLSCLKDSPARPTITCLTHFRPGPESRGDERQWARLAAEAAGCELVEAETNRSIELKPLLRMLPTAEPYSCLPFMQNDGIEARVATERGATAVFSGAGGDQTFYHSHITLAASDAAQRYGLSLQMMAAAHNAARLERNSIWRVMSKALGDARARRHCEPYIDAGSQWKLLAPGLVEAARNNRDYTRHPWLEHARSASIGKQWHIYSLSIPATYYSARGAPSDPEYVNPILSQPVIETALSIPTYILTRGGWDRALARKAFAGDIPSAIANRRSKGLADDLAETILTPNLGFVREMLLDGLLVKQGYLDRHLTEEVLKRAVSCAGSPVSEIYHYLSTETWVRSWTDTSRIELAA